MADYSQIEIDAGEGSDSEQTVDMLEKPVSKWWSIKNNANFSVALKIYTDSLIGFFLQAILIEGVENLLINLDLKKVAQKALESASENLKRDPYSQRSHSILFVKNKLLAMCSR